MNISKNKLSHIIFIFITLASLTIVIHVRVRKKLLFQRKKMNKQS